MSWKKVRADIGWSGWWFRYKIGENDHWLDFEAHEVVTKCMDGTEEFLIGADISDGVTPDITKARPRFTGYVKWDGCAEFHLEQEHVCSKKNVEEFCEVLKFCHSLCLRIPKVDKKCAGYE